MNLAPAEIERFYHIWFPLLHYINEQRQVVPSFPASRGDTSVEPDDAVKVRDALWANDALREHFVTENPAGLAPEDLALVASWRYRVAGNFYILRYLKKYAVFLTERAPNHAYGVLGLVSPIEDIVAPYLPVYVQAVLLPFEDRIIYDSLLASYPITFGSGIRASLNDAYRDAKEREGIIISLLPAAPLSPDAARKEIAARNGKILTAFRKELARAGLSAKMQEEHAGQIAAFAERDLLAQDPPRALLDLAQSDIQDYLAGAGATANRVSFKRFIRFLYETSRLDPGEAESLLRFLRNAKD